MKIKQTLTRRKFVKELSLLAGVAALPGISMFSCKHAPGSQMKLGLVTYLWGKDWDIPTLIKNCTATEILGVELRVEHAHGVMPNLSDEKRKEVKKRFDNSPVEIVGLGTNQDYDSPDEQKLRRNIEGTKAFIKLSADVGGSGVKVKPNRLHVDKGIPKEETLEQIGRALNEVGTYAADYNQQIRVEVHGRDTQELPNMKTIMDVANHPNVTVCWNCNMEDLNGEGLEYNFNLVKDRFGDTAHVRELNIGEYPYQQLMDLFVQMDYKGWILLECRTDPEDKVKALIEQREVWKKMIGRD